MTNLSDIIKGISSVCRIVTGGSDECCRKIESALHCSLPSELDEFYSRWISLSGEYGLAVMWPPDRVIDENLRFRNSEDLNSIYMSFYSCLFFADAGNGDLFFVPIYSDGVPGFQVYVWNHETDERVWVATHVHQYIKKWVDGEINI